jgi:predicted protein tyrosine phosphatase
MAWVLGQEPWGWNTRAAGAALEYALIPVDKVLLSWADLILFANEENRIQTEELFPGGMIVPFRVLDLPDNYEYRDEALVALIREKMADQHDA